MTAGLNWIEPAAIQVPDPIRDLVGGPWFLSEALVRRGLSDAATLHAFFDPALYTTTQPGGLPDLYKTADRLEHAIRSHQIIGVWGDFDVDGQTATAVLVHTLQNLGGKVKYYIPVRARDSHGVALPALINFLKQGIDLLLTCDTGVSAHEAAQFMRTQKIDFYITDHHTLPDMLPNASAIVNPQRLDRPSPLSYLCGVGVAYKLAEELYQRAGRSSEAEELLDLVALGTIADLAELKGDNRWLVQRGLERIRTSPRPALLAMFELAEIAYAQVSEDQVSFTLAPRLNAIGRLDDANPVVPFLLSSSITSVRTLAAQLEALNARRKMLCDQVFQAAQTQISRDRSLLEHQALVLHHHSWPAGVLGIVASRLVDLYHRPAILLASPPGELARGSARSIEGIQITQAIRGCESLLNGFGGHPMAAGLSLDAANIPDFRRELDRQITSQSADAPPVTDLAIDAFLPLENLTLDLVESINRLAPFGPGNPPLILASRNLSLQNHITVGKTAEHLQMIVEDSASITRKLIWWQGAGAPLPEGRFDLAYTVRANNYRGQRAIQLEWLGFKPIEILSSISSRRKLPIVEDFRNLIDPNAALTPLISLPDAIIFAEGEITLPCKTIDRYHTDRSTLLILWSVPSSRSDLRNLLEVVMPHQVFWFGTTTAVDQPAPFITRLSGLIQYAIKNRQGQVSISKLAAATGQRDRTVFTGLAWLAARGHITLETVDQFNFKITSGGIENQVLSAGLEQEIKSLIQETAAFRAYCQRADLKTLLV